eukprot:g1875.t1
MRLIRRSPFSSTVSSRSAVNSCRIVQNRPRLTSLSTSPNSWINNQSTTSAGSISTLYQWQSFQKQQQFRHFSAEATTMESETAKLSEEEQAKIAEEGGGSNPDGTDKIDPEVLALVDEICKLNIIQLADLGKALQEKLGVSDQMLMGGGGMVMPAGGMPAGGAAAPGADAAGAAEEAAEEKDSFDLKLTGFDAKSKIKVIKEVRAISGLGLKEAKAAVDDSPSVLMQGVSKADAEKFKAQLEKVGAEISLE